MNIVVGVDGSTDSNWALGWIGKMPWRSAPSVTALHAVDIDSVRVPVVTHPIVSGHEPDAGEALHMVEARAKQVEAETKRHLAKLGLRGTVRVEKGTIAPKLIQRASRNELIAVGSRGLDAIDRLVLGSVSTAVTLHASCSVLVVKEPPQTLRRILVATDGSPSSTKALQFLTKQLTANQKSVPIVIVLVHVMPFLRYMAVKEAGEKLLAEGAAKLEKAGYRVRQFPQVGAAAEEIMKVANIEQPDLIITGAKGRSAVARFLQGSVSLKLMQQSACSILVVR